MLRKIGVNRATQGLMAGALLTALAGAPTIAHAGTAQATEIAEGSPGGRTRAAPNEGRQYAAREAAKPELGDFKGGDSVIYIGGGTVVLVLLIVLIVLLL
jgi:hypothetical protein